MQTRKLGPFDSSAIGLGGMCLSHAYGTPPDHQTAAAVLLRALDLGYTHIDSAALYGFGANETLIGQVLSGRRNEFILVTKGGMFRNAQGQREIDGRPEMIKKNCEESLQRLKTDVIDLYYLHRWDKRLPIEESVGALADLVKDGKVKAIGLSEVSAKTLRRAHAVHPITALQTEYSLWTRDVEENGVLKAVRELGIGFVPYSPLGRGILTGRLTRFEDLAANDFRRRNPRFQGENFERNLELVREVDQLAREKGVTPGQLALAWVLSRGEDVVPIPGTKHVRYLEENVAATHVDVTAADLARLDTVFPVGAATGDRYLNMTLVNR